MAETIVIRLHDSGPDQVSWYPLGKHPSPLAPRGEGTLTQAAEMTRGWRLLAIAPSSDLLLTKVNIPSNNRQRLIQAIPFTLENDLTEEIEQLHFALNLKTSQDGAGVAVISRVRLETWLESFHSLQLTPFGLYPDFLCLPFTDTHWSIYLENNLALVRTGQTSGFSAELENLSLFLKMAIVSAATPPEQFDLFLSPKLDREQYPALISDEIEISRKEIPFPGDLTRLLVENLDERETLNLLQGDYAQVDKSTVQWRRWLPAAMLFVFLAGLNVVSSTFDNNQYKRQNEQLSQEIRQVFRETFPELKRIVDPRVQMEQQLKLLRKGTHGGQAEFLSLMNSSAVNIAKIPGNLLQSINFRDNQLDLKLTLKDLQSLETIKKAIEAEGLAVEIKSANASGSQVTSHLRIRRGES